MPGSSRGATIAIDELLGDEPQPEPDPEPDPRSGPRPTPLDQQRKTDCRNAGGQGWVNLGSTDPNYGNRATGIEACLDSAYLATHPGSDPDVKKVTPPGYLWGKSYAGWLGLDSRYTINACHLLASQLSGSGTDLRNLSTCSRAANTYTSPPGSIDENMYYWEDQVKVAIDSGQVVHYRVVPKYLGDRTAPVSYEMTAEGVYSDGRPGIRFDEPVPNMLYSPSRGRKNLGAVTDSRTNLPVPIGATP
ncbi:DNA/RNA non-specific endonuclease [Streptomyces sp. TLI_171]|uniref:DNA/RNA non-specific endonuclease n=1 Tax=Streptomyces sp. TLI_171 TaxID=1938859 RepID=UPI000C67F596|nr:DNA/RNA non-specific endonuclease [Streptomyces sp. TLI_171]RKE05011.1 DNA/RNA non-specific endonuclease [Streptomyces sp. TLI_171]